MTRIKTLEGFLRVFARMVKAKRPNPDVNWFLTGDGAIRTGVPYTDSTCPLVAVAGGQGVNGWAAGRHLGMARKDVNTIISAADNRHGPYGKSKRATVRARMLKATGL